MDYDLSFITTTGEDISNTYERIDEGKRLLTNCDNVLSTNWQGLSFNNYKGIFDILISRYNICLDDMNEIKMLVLLINKHNELRKKREANKARISSLYANLYETFVNDEGETEERERPGVRSEIESLESENEKINGQMEALINSIRGITGG